MTDTPVMVSIVMNCHNSDHFLKDAIASIFAQTYSNWEIIFWDNASTDQSATIAQSFESRLKYYYTEKKTPLGQARNLAMKKASGKYVAFLDCDDLYLPTKLKQQVELMESARYALSYGSAIIINKQGNKTRQSITRYKSGYIFGDLLTRYEINMQSVMIRRTVLESEQLSFPIDYQFGPDYDLFMDIASKYPIGVMKEFTVKTRVLTDSLSRKTLHRVPYEISNSLNRILSNNPLLKKQFPHQIKSAYQKINYYQTVDYIDKGRFKDARGAIQSIIHTRIEYFILYLLLYLPVQPNTLLRLLKR